VTAVLTILALLVVPLATPIAMGTYHHELGEAAATAAQRTAVTAVLLIDPEPQHATSSEQGANPEIRPNAGRVGAAGSTVVDPLPCAGPDQRGLVGRAMGPRRTRVEPSHLAVGHEQRN
jgi:hypothetical protein